jgi:hypothetical protein
MNQETKCEKCNHKAEFRLVDKLYCARCFTELAEQKIRHNLRRYDIKKDSTILATDELCVQVLKKVINMPVKIVTGKQKSDYIALPWTLDDENEEFLKNFFEKKSGKEEKKIIRLFYPLSKDDVKAYCRIKKIAYHKNRPKDRFLGCQKCRLKGSGCKSLPKNVCDIFVHNPEKTEINEILDRFDRKYPGTKTSILRSGETLSNLR